MLCMYVYIFYIYTASYYSVCIGLRYSCGYIVMFGHLRVKLPFRPLGQPRLEILEPRPSPKPSSSAIHLHYPLVICYIAIENGHRNSGFTHWKLWFSIVMLVYQRVNRHRGELWPVGQASFSDAVLQCCCPPRSRIDRHGQIWGCKNRKQTWKSLGKCLKQTGNKQETRINSGKCLVKNI